MQSLQETAWLGLFYRGAHKVVALLLDDPRIRAEAICDAFVAVESIQPLRARIGVPTAPCVSVETECAPSNSLKGSGEMDRTCRALLLRAQVFAAKLTHIPRETLADIATETSGAPLVSGPVPEGDLSGTSHALY
ncbi:hypothetical protein PI125_g22809 [Phytophthora idaei]|nr:hypothetical protein PI125_g22809 [Phytophthora idaei]